MTGGSRAGWQLSWSGCSRSSQTSMIGRARHLRVRAHLLAQLRHGGSGALGVAAYLSEDLRVQADADGVTTARS